MLPRCGFALAFAVAGCAPLNGVGASSEAAQQSRTHSLRHASAPAAVGRSGEAEALADIGAGRPIKLYFQSLFGEREFIRTPGLKNCNPHRYDVTKNAREQFEHLNADYFEDIQYSPEEHARITAATQFAEAYNVTMFKLKRVDVLKICPAAALD